MKVRRFFLIFSIFIGLSLPQIAFSAVILSPGDTVIENGGISLSGTLPDSLYGVYGVGGVCLGIREGSHSDRYCHSMSNDYLNNGIEASIYSASVELGGNKLEIINGMVNCKAGLCDTKHMSLFANDLSGAINNHNYKANLRSIKITVSKKVKPGVYNVRLRISGTLISGAEKSVFNNLIVIVKNTTCTMTNKVINIGEVLPGNKTIKKINLNLNCNNIVNSSSWKYTNVNYGGDYTNLKNVSIKIKNKKNKTLEDNKDYPGIDTLNDIFIEIDAKKNAQGGKLNVPLRFTLTYS